ncbi:Dabb family protein [Rhodococcus coprophilus]|uniref:Stress responsive A/B Barrel Domain n=1 Tax=Rhodococcus coprophilus TaxID=38310 RepID=A0A2X4UCF1_9NOCA|nr:Dabb family protein [Rhodococcus coprophilus]SQI36289.1 Stress responsive A/B Barrel Domain [Rhodococcus coprophilus]
MYNVTRVVHFEDSANASDRAEYLEKIRHTVKGLGAPRHLVAPTLPGVINGGELLVHLQLPAADGATDVIGALDRALEGPATARIDGVQYPASPGQSRPDAPRSVYRALLLRIAPGTPTATVERFERDLLTMPRYISSIGAWRLDRVEKSVGPTAWTHVWEQEFTDHASLIGQYLDHPVHWGVVDRWFDPECPEAVVRDRVCHTFCLIDDTVIR